MSGNNVAYINIEGGGSYAGTIIIHYTGEPRLVGRTLVLMPRLTEGGIQWSCTPTGYDTLDVKYRPTSCRP